jgi:malonate decarboxylase epsilon subunit
MFDAFAADATARDVFAEAAAILGYDPRERADDQSLRSTVHVQVGLLLCGLASLRVLEEYDAHPSLVAGQSVGAFAAAVACGSLGFADALNAVLVRAQVMERLYPSGYGMGVCAGVGEGTVRAAVDRLRASGRQVYVANVNAAAQIAVSGELLAVDSLLEQCRRGGARRAERLAVAVPSHCELMQPVADALRERLSGSAFLPPRVAYVSATAGAILRDAQAIRDDLCDGVAREVRWDRAAGLIHELRTRCALEAVPGRVLTDLWTSDDRMRVAAMDGARLDSSAALVRRYTAD